MKKNLCCLLCAALLFSASGCSSVEIEDTNGADDYSLATITEENIINEDLGASGLSKSESSHTDLITYSSKNFSGVEEIYTSDYFMNSDVIIEVNTLSVTEGNLSLVVLLDDEIVHEFKAGELTETFEMEDVNGTVDIKIAGESAKFEFQMKVW